MHARERSLAEHFSFISFCWSSRNPSSKSKSTHKRYTCMLITSNTKNIISINKTTMANISRNDGRLRVPYFTFFFLTQNLNKIAYRLTEHSNRIDHLKFMKFIFQRVRQSGVVVNEVDWEFREVLSVGISISLHFGF